MTKMCPAPLPKETKLVSFLFHDLQTLTQKIKLGGISLFIIRL